LCLKYHDVKIIIDKQLVANKLKPLDFRWNGLENKIELEDQKRLHEKNQKAEHIKLSQRPSLDDLAGLSIDIRVDKVNSENAGLNLSAYQVR
jgi:hypothetical protein